MQQRRDFIISEQNANEAMSLLSELHDHLVVLNCTLENQIDSDRVEECLELCSNAIESLS